MTSVSPIFSALLFNNVYAATVDWWTFLEVEVVSSESNRLAEKRCYWGIDTRWQNKNLITSPIVREILYRFTTTKIGAEIILIPP